MKNKLLNALELDKNGDLQGAHNVVKDMGNKEAYWIHGYLHRKEMDLDKASYWYYRAKRPIPKTSFEKEWQEIHDFIRQNYIS
ncbi:MAG: hypothetical protein JW761_14300 [Prolixibacteraceae bacterium]|nr:hypothetical protein [Prolixibacteraceae bacterium]